MRWTRMARQTNVACADGEVAWSRPPDAEVKLAMMLRITPATGARKPGPRGDRDISRKPSRRECRLIRLNLWRLPACFFIAGGPWVRSSPGIPCALFVFPRAKLLHCSGVNASRDRVDVSTSRINPGRMLRVGVSGGPQLLPLGAVDVSRFRCCAEAPVRASHATSIRGKTAPRA